MLYFFYTFGANNIAGDARPIDNKILWINRFSLLTWIISGYIGALVSKRFGVLIGLFLGYLSLIGVSVTQYWFGGYNGIIYVLKSDWLDFLFLGIILCCIGGLVWDIQSYLLKRFSNHGIDSDS